MKYALFVLSLVAIILGIVGYAQVFGAIGSGTAQCAQYINNQQAYQQCILASEQQFSSGLSNGSALLFIGLAFVFEGIAWILGLVWTVIHRRWGWFISVLLFTPLATLLYSLFGPDGSIFDSLLGRKAGASNTPGFDALPNQVRPGLCWQCGGQVKLDSRICLHCGATQANVEVRTSLASKVTGFDQDNANGAFPPVPHPVSGVAWAPPPGYQQPGQAPAMPAGYPPPDYHQQSGYQQPGYPPSSYPPPGYQQSAYPPPDYQQSGYQQPGQPPAPGGSGWGQGYN